MFFRIEKSSEGISLDKDQTKAIKHALRPSNISELIHWIMYICLEIYPQLQLRNSFNL